MTSKQRIDVSREIMDKGLYFETMPERYGYEGAMMDYWDKKITFQDFQAQVSQMEANNTDGTAFNLVVNDGATLALNAAGMKRSADVVEGATTKWYCSIDGGILHPGWYGNFAGSGATTPDRTIVGEGGIVIDTGMNGGDETRNTASRYGQAFECPTGKVVTAISLPTDERFHGADGALYLGPTDVTISGKGAYLASVAVNFVARSIGQHWTVTLDDTVIEDDFALVSMCNGRYYGGGFTPIPEARMNDGILHTIIVKSISNALFIRYLANFMSVFLCCEDI